MHELETKHVLRGRKPGKALRRLLQDLVWAGFHAHPKGTRLVRDVYYDTADQRLKCAGWSLRCRRSGTQTVLACKQLTADADGWFERREVEQSSPHHQPDMQSLPDGPVADLLRRYLSGATDLVPLFSLTNRRTSYALTHPEHPRGVIELVMDRVHVDGDPPMRYVEFEAELKQGTSELLTEFADVMMVQPEVIPSRTSKFQRGLFNTRRDLALDDRKRELMTPRDTWSKLGGHYLAEQFDTLTAYAPYAYEGLHIEGVHQMRVATRRMRAALRAFDSLLPVDTAAHLIDEAGWLCDVLGDVRDLDVQLSTLDRYQRALPGTHQATLRAYRRHLRGEHRRARQCLVAALESRRYLGLLSNCRQLQLHAESFVRSDPLTIAEFAQAYVPAQLRNIRKAGRKIDRNAKDRKLHRLRIKIKRLRYELEILSGPYGKPLEKATRHLSRLQSTLGDHQDACVARTKLAGYRDAHARDPSEARTFDRLIELESKRAAKLRQRFGRDWARFEKESYRLAEIL